jgi:hypothetical protein
LDKPTFEVIGVTFLFFVLMLDFLVDFYEIFGDLNRYLWQFSNKNRFKILTWKVAPSSVNFLKKTVKFK